MLVAIGVSRMRCEPRFMNDEVVFPLRERKGVTYDGRIYQRNRQAVEVRAEKVSWRFWVYSGAGTGHLWLERGCI